MRITFVNSLRADEDPSAFTLYGAHGNRIDTIQYPHFTVPQTGGIVVIVPDNNNYLRATYAIVHYPSRPTEMENQITSMQQ